MVLSGNINAAWPHVSPILKPAVDLQSTHDIEDVRKALLSGQAHLWMQWSGKADGAAVTEFINYPKGLWLRVWLTGAAQGAQMLWKEFEEMIFGFADRNKCTGIEYWGRAGWLRRFKHVDFKNESIVARHLLNRG